MRKFLVFISVAVLTVSFFACSDSDDGNSSEELAPPALMSSNFTDIGFNDIASVFDSVAATDTVVFLLRHAERGSDYSRDGLLTENGKKQAQKVGGKIKNGEQAFYAHSDYERTKQTCENIAIGREETDFVHEEWSFLSGDWYKEDADLLKKNGWDSWKAVSQWAYNGGYEGGFYDLDERSEEWLDSLRTYLPGMKRINVLVSHDYQVLAMTVFASNKEIDLHYYANWKWINYLAGIAIIIDQKGKMTFKTVRGLSSGVM
jgi:broad specificity phosphatase PhoE